MQVLYLCYLLLLLLLLFTGSSDGSKVLLVFEAHLLELVVSCLLIQGNCTQAGEKVNTNKLINNIVHCVFCSLSFKRPLIFVIVTHR